MPTTEALAGAVYSSLEKAYGKFIALARSITGLTAMAVVSMFGPMMYLMPSLASFSALEMEIFGSFLSSSATISILYFLPPISTPPLALYISAVVSAQYLLTRPHDAAAPDITPLTPIFRTLSGVAPSDAPLLIKAARDLGFKGQLSTETGQDAKILEQVAGEKAAGFLSVGGASTPAIQSDYMKQFVEVYKKRVGEWNDEAGTKAYALELILAVLQKNPKALTDVEQFRKEMPSFKMTNPFVKDKTTLQFVGKKDFGRQSQVGVPLVVNAYKGGGFEAVYVGQVAN